MKRTWFLDMDGLLIDYSRGYMEHFGHHEQSVSDEQMWDNVHSKPSFFRDLQPCPGALEFFNDVRRLDPVILTACPEKNYDGIARQKIACIREHFCKDIWVLPIRGGRNKPLFMRKPGDVLIDDFDRNTDAWTEAGGTAILHRDHNFHATRIAMAEIIDTSQYQTTTEFYVAAHFPRYGGRDRG